MFQIPFFLSLPIYKNLGEETTANDLTAKLQDVWYRWYEIGVVLRIPTHELDTICGKDTVMNKFQVLTLYHALSLILRLVTMSIRGETPFALHKL